MKILILAAALFIFYSSFSQSVTGKWKPVFFSVDTLLRGDVEKDTTYMNPNIKEIFKDDDNPELSAEMMKMLFDKLFERVKVTQEEFAANGVYTETNTKTNQSRAGTYQFDQKTKTLKRTITGIKQDQTFQVSWKNDRLVLTTELNSKGQKKGKLEVVYKKI